MKVGFVYDLLIEILFVALAFPFVFKYGISPWQDFGGFGTLIEKTALETSAELQDNIKKFTGADMYLSVAVSDAVQPDTDVMVFYKTAGTLEDSNLLSKEPSDGFKSSGTKNYYTVYYATDKSPSTVNNKMSVGRKLLSNTGYDLDAVTPMILQPKLGDPDDNNETMKWLINRDVNSLDSEELGLCQKHGWLYFQ